MPFSLIIRNIKQIVTLKNPSNQPRRGKEMENLEIIENGAIGIEENKIAWVGKDENLPKEQITENTQIIPAYNFVAMPGFVDPHTHPVFSGTREVEFEMRVKGKSYQEIALSGGGIRSSVRKTRGASVTDLVQKGLPRLNRMLDWGTTTIEAKSGYGLSTEDEIKQLEAIKECDKLHPIDLIPTFLGAHEIPDEYRENREEYIRLVIEEMIPLVARKKLAVFCDVFCEEHVFNIDESRKILQAAQNAGLKLKLHADELSPFGGAELAAELNAISADHLVAVSDEGIKKMKESDVIPVLLPGTTFSLGLKEYAPARKIIEEGLPVALATDCNPGSCYTESIPIIIAIACTRMRMTPAEAITATTLNAAYAIDNANDIGSIEPGKKADILLFNMPSYQYLPYHFGVNHLSYVIKNGNIVRTFKPNNP